jgi:hypothetical protein
VEERTSAAVLSTVVKWPWRIELSSRADVRLQSSRNGSVYCPDLWYMLHNAKNLRHARVGHGAAVGQRRSIQCINCSGTQ